MKVFLRLVSYIWPYRSRFFLGVLLSFFVALLNGISLSAFVPIFEALGEDSDTYLIQFSLREREILRRAFVRPGILEAKRLPPPPQRIDAELAQDLLLHLQNSPVKGLDFLAAAELRTLLYIKLKINAAAFAPLWVILFACLIALPLWTLKLILFLLCVRLISRGGYLAVRNIRRELYLKVQRLPLTWFYRHKSGELVSRLSNDAELVAAVVSSNMRSAITNVFYILVHVLLLAYLNLELLVVSIVTVPVILLPITLFTRKIRKSTHRSQNLLADMHAHLQETISGMKLIRLTRMEEHERHRFRHINNRLYWRRFKEIYYTGLGPYLTELNSVIVTLGILSLGAVFLDPSDFTSGEFLVFMAVLLFIIQPIIQLSGMYAKLQEGIAAGVRIFEIMDKDFEVKDPVQPLKLAPLSQSIRFENVCFQYPETDRQVLHDITLEIPMGSTVALVGSSGGGKSTLMDLVARFFSPTSGRILFDGQDIQDFRIKDHRSRLGIVTQDIFLFYGTVLSNIAYGKQQCSPLEVEKAARLAYAHDFINEFEQGYQTSVGNRGLNLSGGQRQRIAIARALLRDPEILILDEATSALDTQSERLVQKALERLFRNRTTFVIAHRLSTIEKADNIIVLSDGRVAEQGTHASLLKKDGHYARLQKINQK